MKNALTYLTRGCPRNCEYCALRDAVGVGKELDPIDWIEAFHILKSMGVEFNLILGNETWLLGMSLLDVLRHNKVPYALYTTCPEPGFSKYNFAFYSSGIIDNLSCGIDYPCELDEDHPVIADDSYFKSEAAWKGFQWIKQHFPLVDTQGTITVHRNNLHYLPKLVTQLSDLGVFVGINFIHWNSDGKFDFFPQKEEIQHLLFDPTDYPYLDSILDQVLKKPGLLQNPQFLQLPAKTLATMGWHCNGDPYGGPTIDSDGKLRCCGYRRGTHTPKFSIFDLPEKEAEWKEAVRMDAMECPGCCWSYPWMTHYWQQVNPELGKAVFTKHGGDHIPEEKWSKRKLQ